MLENISNESMSLFIFLTAATETRKFNADGQYWKKIAYTILILDELIIKADGSCI